MPIDVAAWTAKETDLLARWKAKAGEPFHEDGAVDPPSYWKAKRRILYLLKEG